MLDSASVARQVADLTARLQEHERRHVPFATALALTRTAQATQVVLRQEMRRVFRNPRGFTLQSLYAKPARVRDLEADVHFKDFAPKGTAAGKYLRPQVLGGSRPQKPFERLLMGTGAGMFWAPVGDSLNLGQLQKVLSALGVQRDPYQNATRGRAPRGKRRNETYFVSTGRKAGVKAGVYMRQGRQAVPVIRAIRPPTYSRRFDMAGVSRRTMLAKFPDELRKAIDFALATARTP